MTADCVLALGQHGQYYYRGPTKQVKQKTDFVPLGVKAIRCVAYGSTANSYFASYTDKDGRDLSIIGPACPAALLQWLYDEDFKNLRRSRETRVALGPGESFVAWDGASVRWSGIPAKLEERLQEWIGNSETYGTLRVVCLGKDKAFLVTTTKAYWQCSDLSEGMKNMLIADRAKAGHTIAAAVSIHTSQWVFIRDDFHAYYLGFELDTSGEEEEILCSVLDPVVYNPTEVLQRKILRLEAGISRRNIRIATLEAEKVLEKAQTLWRPYSRDCDRYFAQKQHTSFIDLPDPPKLCTDKGCAARKSDTGSIGICKHEMRSILRTNPSCNIAFLRKERLKWHPDKFARGCDPSVRAELASKATQMYAIMEELIAEENKKSDKENRAP